MASEKIFENKVKKYIEEQGGYWIKHFANRMTKVGIPDLIICINGYFVAAEIKAKNGHPSELQIYNCKKIREAGGFSFILYPSGFDEFKRIIRGLKGDFWNLNEPLVLK